MRLRKERHLAGGMAIRIRFLGLEQRFEHDLSFAPIDDTSTLLALLGGQLERLAAAKANGRWRPARCPPLSVAVTLTGLEPAGSMTAELMPERDRAKQMSAVLDTVNRRYGNNALYFGAMQEALVRGAAPMRIPFSAIPDTELEEDVAPRTRRGQRDAGASGHALWALRERQFKVLAEESHRQANLRRKPHAPSGAGGWAPKSHRAETAGLAPGASGELF
jgi:DNA polymerase-4